MTTTATTMMAIQHLQDVVRLLGVVSGVRRKPLLLIPLLILVGSIVIVRDAVSIGESTVAVVSARTTSSSSLPSYPEQRKLDGEPESLHVDEGTSFRHAAIGSTPAGVGYRYRNSSFNRTDTSLTWNATRNRGRTFSHGQSRIASVTTNHTQKTMAMLNKEMLSNHSSIQLSISNSSSMVNATTISSTEEATPVIKVPINNATETLLKVRTPNATFNVTSSGKLHEGRRRHRVSLIIQLAGEMANNLAFFAHGIAIKLHIEREFPALYVDLVAEHQDTRKWKAANASISKCFPRLAAINILSGKWDPAYQQYAALQNNILDSRVYTNVDHPCEQGGCWRESALFAERVFQQQHDNPQNYTIQDPQTSPSLTLPFLRSERMTITDLHMEEFYDEIRDYMQMDEETCCDLRPTADETVFHFRNFVHEGQGLLNRGFQEMSPKQTVTDLMSHLPRGSKVTIVTRGDMGQASNVQSYVQAFERHGFNTTVLASRSGTHDFCYLKSTQKELIGSKTSTYALWAGLLGDMQNATYYFMDSPITRKAKQSMFNHYQFQREDLRQKIRFETFVAKSR